MDAALISRTQITRGTYVLQLVADDTLTTYVGKLGDGRYVQLLRTYEAWIGAACMRTTDVPRLQWHWHHDDPHERNKQVRTEPGLCMHAALA